MSKTIRIADLMESSGVTFGTSGARGPVRQMTDAVCFAYTLGFLAWAERRGDLPPAGRVAVAGDLRPSTAGILAAVARAIAHRGHTVIHCGRIPSPALALYGIREGLPSIMVTGSHIPDDRNGIKFHRADGEILKEDEAAIREEEVRTPDLFDSAGRLRAPADVPPADGAAAASYRARWVDAFPDDFLAGMRIGFYEHSAVGRDLLPEIYEALGADVVRLERSERFIPVDTEAIRPEDVALAAGWSQELDLDAIVSTDGDSDRPLVADENGKWMRGDIAGILCARFLGADTVVTPVSSNTAVERSGWFDRVLRTRIGSPWVVGAMLRAARESARTVVGYEANGGFLTASRILFERRALDPLPTRDAVIVHLAILGSARRRGVPVSSLLAELPARFTSSDRIREFPTERSRARLEALAAGGPDRLAEAFPALGPVAAVDTTDGLRMTFASGDVLHLRPSGNAPELRCYTESDSESRAAEINRAALAILETWRQAPGIDADRQRRR